MDELHERVASNIRHLAKRKAITLSHLPDRAGVSRAHFWKVLNGSQSATLTWLGRVAAALEVDAMALLEKDPAQPTDAPPQSDGDPPPSRD